VHFFSLGLGCTFLPQKVDNFFSFLVVAYVSAYTERSNVQTSKQHGKNLAVDQRPPGGTGPPLMVQPTQWLIRPWRGNNPLCIRYCCKCAFTQISEAGSGASANRSISDAERRHHVISNIVNRYAVPVVCFFGIVGNLLNLVVLTRKRLTRRYLER